jgi:5-methylcytosine-specific restriction endonuclease McrA
VSAARNTTRRDRHRKAVARGRPPCHLCGQAINYEAHHLEPLSFTIHHVIPLNRGGPDELFLEDGTPQIVPACRKCNRDQGDRLPGETKGTPRRLPVSFVTSRAW